MNALKSRLTLTAVIALVALIGSSHAQSQDNIGQQFVGMWRLASWQERLVDGTTRQHPSSVAYLIYTDTNHMCYVGMNPNRPKWSSTTAPTEAEALSGLGDRAFYAYCATVEIHANQGFVLHHVDVDKVPNNVGLVRKRWFTFLGPNRVSLRIDTPAPPVVESTLTWERVTK